MTTRWQPLIKIIPTLLIKSYDSCENPSFWFLTLQALCELCPLERRVCRDVAAVDVDFSHTDVPALASHHIGLVQTKPKNLESSTVLWLWTVVLLLHSKIHRGLTKESRFPQNHLQPAGSAVRHHPQPCMYSAQYGWLLHSNHMHTPMKTSAQRQKSKNREDSMYTQTKHIQLRWNISRSCHFAQFVFWLLKKYTVQIKYIRPGTKSSEYSLPRPLNSLFFVQSSSSLD